MRRLTALPLASVLLLAAATAARAQVPAQAQVLAAAPVALGVKVELAQKRKLRLVKGPGKTVGLDGVLVVTVTNTGDRALRLRDLEEHGLVFVAKDGALTVSVHSCKCVKDATDPAGAVYELKAGARRTIAIEEFGCGGGAWPAPAPGRYRVEYRVLLAPDPLPASQPTNPAAQTQQCDRDLTSPAFWTGASASPALDVTLKKPKR